MPSFATPAPLALTLALVLATAAGCGSKPEPPPITIAPARVSSDPPPTLAPVASSSASTAPSSSARAPHRFERRTDAQAADLFESIRFAIAMLEAQEYRAFLGEFAAPEDLAHFDKDGGLDGLLPHFIEDKAKPLLRILRKTQSMTPVRAGNRAKFEFPPNEKDITWVEDGGRWYIKN